MSAETSEREEREGAHIFCPVSIDASSAVRALYPSTSHPFEDPASVVGVAKAEEGDTTGGAVWFEEDLAVGQSRRGGRTAGEVGAQERVGERRRQVAQDQASGRIHFAREEGEAEGKRADRSKSVFTTLHFVDLQILTATRNFLVLK